MIPALVGIGLAAGFFSGLFGVGGGLIVVPGLVVILHLDQRRAVGTSLLAILPAVLGSLAAYAVAGSVNVAVGTLLALGAVGGAQLGSWLLQRMSVRVAQWVFIGFVAAMLVQLVLLVPDRATGLVLDPPRIVALVLLGLVAGVLSAVLGIGGGGVVVPMLMLLGASDLGAKGASLLMMVPTVFSGMVANLRRRNVDLRAGLVVGVSSLVTGPLGAWVAHLVPPQVGSWLFAGFLAFIGATMLRQVLLPSRLQAGPRGYSKVAGAARTGQEADMSDDVNEYGLGAPDSQNAPPVAHEAKPDPLAYGLGSEGANADEHDEDFAEGGKHNRLEHGLGGAGYPDSNLGPDGGAHDPLAHGLGSPNSPS